MICDSCLHDIMSHGIKPKTANAKVTTRVTGKG